MMHLLFIVNVLIWASVSVAVICSHLPGYSKYGTSCFKLYTVGKTWAAAEASCVADGGHLASIHSTEEQDFVANLVGNSSDVWIGVSGIPPHMTWSDNTNMDYTFWRGANPNVNGESCGRLVATHSFKWLDKSCTMSYYDICRTDQVVDQTQSYFMLIPDGAPVDVTIVPSSTQTVVSVIDCAQRCQQDAQCVHFIVSEDGGKYLCETYTSLLRPTTATPPTDNYQKVV